MSKRQEVLEEAIKATMGDRNKTYGDPTEQHERAAEIYNAMSNSCLTARDIVDVLIAVKLSRLQVSPAHHDTHVDIAAYAAIRQEITDNWINYPRDED